MMVQKQLKTPGQIITFYSYKGGTGRSMALANVACLLAKPSGTNEKVLMIDWDLEAPGLHWFFHENFKTFFTESNNREQALKNHLGLIDLFETLKDVIQRPDFTGHNEETVQTLINQFDFQPFILKTDIHNLYLIKAGCLDENYSNKVNTFQWLDFYNRAPSLFRLLAERLMEDYKYVVIDSRTGVTDTSGICTMLMPEKLVTVFTPNRQSLEGVLGLIEQVTDYRKQSDDLRPLVVFPLPSRIEASEPNLRQTWRFGEESKQIIGYQKQFEQLFQKIYGLSKCNLKNYFDEVQIQHLSRYAYGEEIAVLTEEEKDRLSLTRSYETFTEKLLKFDSPWQDSKDEFDVFLMHSSSDKPQVREIYNELKRRGLKPWFDEEQLRPGSSFIDEIVQAIPLVKCVAIFIGIQGLEDRQNLELELLVKICVKGKKGIIPVLLPGVSNAPEHLLFLRQFRSVNFSKKLDDVEALNLLVWSITGNSPDELRTDKEVDYTRLRNLLEAGKWKEADEETLTVMLKASGREAEGLLNDKFIENFPCTDLRTIDQLWVKYSNGRFGFSVQKRIWESVGGNPDANYETFCKFADRVGWRVKKDWISYPGDVFFSTLAPVGHLPLGRSTGFFNSERGRLRASFLAQRLVKCNI